MKKLLLLGLATALIHSATAAEPGKTNEPDLRAWEQQHDKLKIRHSNRIFEDTSPQFITVPDPYPEVRDFTVAKTPPVIDFGLVEGIEPEYMDQAVNARSTPARGGWGDVSKGPDGAFYFAQGNHMSFDGGTAYVIRYDPRKRKYDIILDTKKLMGWGPDDYADGKLHGDLDTSPSGDMWLLSYFGPIPTEENWRKDYRGSWLIRLNTRSGEKENLGIALEGESWPYHNWDWRRNLLFGAGHRGNVFIFDTERRQRIYAGAPPDGIIWNSRGIMIDHETGVIYTTDMGTDPGPQHQFVKYERRNNTFTRMKSRMPPHPITGKATRLRSHTRKDADGAFWCLDMGGALFKFYPAEDRVEPVGINWGREGKYVANMSMSPAGRYIYYLPGADRMAHEYGTPVVQYDTTNGRKKVLAFLKDYYLEKYGYLVLGTYGIELDEKGESLFFYVDGRFTPADQFRLGERRAGMFHLKIPASERVE